MARNRQRSKQRQADRRAARLAQRGAPATAPEREPEVEPRKREDDGLPAPPVLDPVTGAELVSGAPPETAGRSDTVLEEDEDVLDAAEDEELEREAAAAGPRGRRGDRADEEHHERGRVAGFLVAVWAELQRVQWPDRATLTSLTAVVLGFVLLAGGYLGLLDAIISRIVQAIL